jgi:AbrB family looped-hinge helix DNA binding protein
MKAGTVACSGLWSMILLHLTEDAFMETTTLSSKGQLILPKSVRDAHHWSAGMKFVVEDTPEGILLRPAKPFPPTTLQEVIGSTGYRGPTKTLEDMAAAIERGARGEDARGRY